MSSRTRHFTRSIRQGHVGEASDDDAILCLAHGFRLWRADDYGWLIRTGADATGEVYACIDESGDEYELMELVHGFRWTTHLSLHAALERLLLHVPLSNDLISEPRAARGADEAARASELSHVIHDWLAESDHSAEGEVGRHRSVV